MLTLLFPKDFSKEKSVGIIGGGLAGVSAAIFLSERGFRVKIFEKEKYLGGKVGSWPVKFDDGFSTQVEHGFHAFFRQYYNLRNLLKKIDALKHLIPIDDYLILTKKHGNYGFKEPQHGSRSEYSEYGKNRNLFLQRCDAESRFQKNDFAAELQQRKNIFKI